MADTLAPLGRSISASGLSNRLSGLDGADQAPALNSPTTSSGSGEGWGNRKRSVTSASTPPSDADQMSSVMSVRSSQFSDSTYDPSDSRIMQASMGHLRGQSTPAVVFAFPASSTKSLPPKMIPNRRSSLVQQPTVAFLPPPSTKTTAPSVANRRTSLPPAPYFRAQPVASTSTSGSITPTPGSPSKRLPRSSTSRRSISSLLGSIFHGPVPGLPPLSPPATPKQPDGFASDSWQHAVAVQVIEAGKGRPAPTSKPGEESAGTTPRPKAGKDKALPVLDCEEKAVGERESYHDAVGAYFVSDGEADGGAGSRHARKPSETSEWSLDVDLGGQGLGIAHIFDGEVEYDRSPAVAAVQPADSTAAATLGHERSRTHSSTLSTSTAFSSLPPVTPRARSTSFGQHAKPPQPRPVARYFPSASSAAATSDEEEGDNPLHADTTGAPHLPDLPPCSPLLAGILPGELPISSLPDDALLDLSPRRRSLRPAGIARPRPLAEDEEEDEGAEELILFGDADGLGLVGKEQGDVDGAAFSLPGEEDGARFSRQPSKRASYGTFGQRRSVLVGGEEVDLDSETEEDEGDGWASEAETRSSVYSQHSATLPLSIPSKSLPSHTPTTLSTPPASPSLSQEGNTTTPTQSAPCSPVVSLRRMRNIDRSSSPGTHSRSSSSTSIASMTSAKEEKGGKLSPERPMKNPKRLALELQKEEGGEGAVVIDFVDYGAQGRSFVA